MENKIKQLLIYLSLIVLVLVGCAESSKEQETVNDDDTYETAIQNGLDALELDHFEKAEAYFEIALEEKNEDETALILLDQTENYVEAIRLFEEKVYEEALEKADAVQAVEDGSTYLTKQANQLQTEIQGILAEAREDEEKARTEEEMFEEFQGVFALFSGTPYESPIDFIFLLYEDITIEGFRQSGYVLSEVTAKSFDGETLVMDMHTAEQPGYGESTQQLGMNLAYDTNDYKYIEVGSEERLYPITVDDLIGSDFNVTGDSEQFINELRAYDKNVPRTISRSNTDLLAGYSAKEIEYARVWLNTIGNLEVAELNVRYESAGAPINYYDDEDSAVYPEDVTIITGYYTADGMIIYSGNGDGTINIYDVPSHWHAPPEEWPDIYEEILDTSTIYLEPMDDEEVVRLIEKMEIQD